MKAIVRRREKSEILRKQGLLSVLSGWPGRDPSGCSVPPNSIGDFTSEKMIYPN
jgi:hypothetical protein